MFLQVSVCPQRGRHTWWQGACMVAGRGIVVGACVVAGGHACLWGACVVVGGGAWLQGGVHGCGEHACFGGGMCGCGGHAWWWGGVRGGSGGMRGTRRDTVNERAVRILLECILVSTFCIVKIIFIILAPKK